MEFFLRRCLAKPVFEFLSLGFVGVLHVKGNRSTGTPTYPWSKTAPMDRVFGFLSFTLLKKAGKS